MQSTKTLKGTTKLVISKKGATYNPSAKSAQGNAATWATVTAACKKPQTYASLMALVKAQHNHAPFIGYAVRRGWLAVK